MSQAPERVKLPFEIWALVTGFFCVSLGYGVVAPALPQLAKSFDVSYTAASAIISAFALMRFVAAPLGGWFANRFGPRTTYMTGILIVAASTGACALAADYTQLVVLRGLGGIGSALFSVAATALMVQLAPPSARGRVSSLNAAGFLLGSLLGPLMGALVAGFGLRAPFVLYFFTLIAACLVVAVALPGARRRAQNEQEETIAPRASLREAIRLPQYRGAVLSFFTSGFASHGVRMSAVPLLLGTVTGDPSIAAWALAAYAVGNAAFIFPSGNWNDRIGRRPFLILGGAVAALGFTLMVWGDTVWIALTAMVVAGCGTAFTGPAQQATIADIVGPRRGGQVISVTQMSSDLGSFLGPLVAGLLIDLTGFGSAFATTAILLAVTAVVWVFTPDSRLLQDQFGPRAAG